MNFLPDISLKSKYSNVCRCCLKEDCFTDISSYFIGSPDETCLEMLQSTFNIQLSSQFTNPKCLICECCIRSLRDAHAFKLMVLQSEEILSKYLQSLQRPGEDMKVTNQVFEESFKTEEGDEVFESSQDYVEDSSNDNEILSNLKDNPLNSEVWLQTTTEKQQQMCRHRKKTKTKRYKIKQNKEIVTDESPQKDWSKISERRGTGPLLRDNSLRLIQHSNLCVFQWNKSQYRCFCCNIPFSDINALKQHTFKEHTLENIEKKIIIQQNRLVKVEISNLECKLCQDKLDNISLLKEHLSRTHSIDLSEDLLVPFRLEEDLKCQICFEKFAMFRLLNIHVNKHFQKQVCHICGAGFSNLVFLNLHKTRSHRNFDCKICSLKFVNKSDKKNHDASVHGVKFERKLRFPCTFCPERFFQENFKVQHMVEKHGMTRPDFKCSVCSKSFITRSLCNNHIKNVHKKEKNQECDICHNLFYTKSDVMRHKVTHTGEKKYSCDMCSSPFASRDSLRRHMKRTHVGVN